jgi:restriction system protein
MNAIFDYSEYIDASEGNIGGFLKLSQQPELFYSNLGYCPICSVKTTLLFDLNKEFSRYKSGSFKLCSCDNCGWWNYDSFHREASIPSQYLVNGEYSLSWSECKYRRIAILRSFVPNDLYLPLDVLLRELKRRPEIIHDIHHRKMEELVKSVFEDYLSCEIEYCGASHDGGIDLYTVNSDHPVCIQVKRRIQPDKVENVSLVREFLGASLLAGFHEAILVSTAHHFSKEADKASLVAVNKGFVDRFTLVDRDRFFRILQISNSITRDPWRNLVPNEWKYNIV